MSLRITFRGDDVGAKMTRNFARHATRIRKASLLSLEEGGRRIIEAGKADMLAGGNFGSPRWQNSLTTDIKQQDKSFIMNVFHKVPFAHVFEYGATIKGRPLLWIPLPWNRNKVRAREFPGRLFRVNRVGKNPLLMTKIGKTASAMYVGVRSVRLKRRFHLRPIIRRVAKQLPFLFKKAMRIAKG